LTPRTVAHQNSIMRRNQSMWIAVVCGAIVGAVVSLLGHKTGLHGATGHLFFAWAFFAKDRALLDHHVLFYACLGCWVVFSIYWDMAARNVAATKSAERKASRGLHVFLANVALLLIAAPIHGLGRFLPVSPPVMMVGLVIEIAGLGLAIWARRHLGRNWSGEITIKEEHQLIQTGPYRYLRHPIYTGLLTMYAGLALATGEWLGVMGMGLAVMAYWRKTRLEEATLGAAFGAEYDAYRRDTWAVVPGVF
jgi:protein-S-isoprenylcysteine O-methyltransferase Ste14